MKEVAQFNKHMYNSIVNPIEEKKEAIQYFVDKYKVLSLKPLNGVELQELFNTPKELFISKITEGEKVEIKGLKVNDNKLFDLLDKPKELEELFNELNLFKADKAKLNFYQISNYTVLDNVVMVDEKRLQALKDANTVYLENKKQKEVFDASNELLKALNNLKSIHKITLSSLDKFIKENENEFYLDATFLKGIK